MKMHLLTRSHVPLYNKSSHVSVYFVLDTFANAHVKSMMRFYYIPKLLVSWPVVGSICHVIAFTTYDGHISEKWRDLVRFDSLANGFNS